jgi:hypothetical protein
MLRKDRLKRVSADVRGKITCGTRSDKGYPKSLDHFNISKFPELVAAYGEKPEKLILFFPSNSIEDFIYSEYCLWATGKSGKPHKKRSCDGEECVHRIEEFGFAMGEVSECVCKNGTEMEEKDKCVAYTSMKAWIADPLTGKIINSIAYQFQSNSKNSSDAVISVIEDIWNMTHGRLIGIPFVLFVRMVTGENAGIKFPLWHIQCPLTINQLMGVADVGYLPTTDETAIQIDLTADTPLLTEKVESPEPDDNGHYSNRLAYAILEVKKQDTTNGLTAVVDKYKEFHQDKKFQAAAKEIESNIKAAAEAE